MGDKKGLGLCILVLIGIALLCFIFAVNAGQKRKDAVSKFENLNAKIIEIDLRYKNAVQTYEAMQKELEDAKNNLQEQQRMTESLKESLQEQQKKAEALKEEAAKLQVSAAAAPVVALEAKASPVVEKKKKTGTAISVQPRKTKIDRTSQVGWAK